MFALQFLSGGFVGMWASSSSARVYGMKHYAGQPFNVIQIEHVAGMGM